MLVDLIPWLITGAFAVVFVYSLIHYVMLRRRHGPPENPRDAFDFDEDAPTYEEPEPQNEDDAGYAAEAESDETETRPDGARKRQDHDRCENPDRRYRDPE